jgi:hypothetical protein
MRYNMAFLSRRVLSRLLWFICTLLHEGFAFTRFGQDTSSREPSDEDDDTEIECLRASSFHSSGRMKYQAKLRDGTFIWRIEVFFSFELIAKYFEAHRSTLKVEHREYIQNYLFHA